MLCVYELKDCINSDNTHVGIITELMFYANVLHRLLITNEIKYPHEADKFRTDKREKASRGLELILDAIHEHSISHIKAVLLTDRLHPLIEYAKEQLLGEMSIGMAAIKFEHSTVLQLMPAELIPAPTYKELQGAQQIRVLQTLPQFNGVKGGGTWKAGLQNIQLPYIIEDGQEVTNIYPSIREAAQYTYRAHAFISDKLCKSSVSIHEGRRIFSTTVNSQFYPAQIPFHQYSSQSIRQKR